MKSLAVKILPVLIFVGAACPVSVLADGAGASRCGVVLDNIKAARERGQLADLDYLPQEIKAAVEKDPEAAELFKNEKFVNYLVGVLERQPINDLRQQLYDIWDDESISGKNLVNALNKVKPLIKADEEAKIPPTAEPTQYNWKERTKYKLASLGKSLASLPATLKRIKALIEKDMHPTQLDSRIFDFKGYLDLKLFSSRLRDWGKEGRSSFNKIRLDQVEGVDPITFVNMAMIAAEIEYPIEAYSDTSGQVLRLLSPQAARFMGKTEEQAEKHQQRIAAKEIADSYCTNSWCFEEARHEGVLLKLGEGVTGLKLPEFQSFSSYPKGFFDPTNMNDAVFHLTARNDTEWHAASAYFILGAHATGASETAARLIREDELKHMAIFGGFYKYLFGNAYQKRMIGMLKKAWLEMKEKGQTTYGNFMTPAMAIEFIYTHIKYEKEIRKFFRSLPLKTLRKLYETQINLPELPSTPLDPAVQAQYDAITAQQGAISKALGRWNKSEREENQKLEHFEAINDVLITGIIAKNFNYFKGSEDYGSPDSLATNAKIEHLSLARVEQWTGKKITVDDLVLLKQSLTQTLRDYQVVNNQHMRSLGLHVRLVNAQTGFEIVRDEAYEKAKKTEI